MGSVNDKTAVKSDDFVTQLRNNPLYSNWEYLVYDSEGRRSMETGLWLNVVGGYIAIPECLVGDPDILQVLTLTPTSSPSSSTTPATHSPSKASSLTSSPVYKHTITSSAWNVKPCKQPKPSYMDLQQPNIHQGFVEPVRLQARFDHYFWTKGQRASFYNFPAFANTVQAGAQFAFL